jgi:hypothetical protein
MEENSIKTAKLFTLNITASPEYDSREFYSAALKS